MIRLNLKKLRKQNKLTQKQLGDILGVSASTIGMYEQGRRQPTVETLVRLSEYFDKPIEKLIMQPQLNVTHFRGSVSQKLVQDILAQK